MPINIKPCKTCDLLGVAQDGQPTCFKFKIPIEDINSQGCSWHIFQSSTCDLCKQKTNNIFIWQDDNNNQLILCENCFNQLHTCNNCTYINICGFKNDHSEPQIVMQQTQKGFMTMQTQVKNPRLIQKHCPSCRCSYGHNDTNCMKDENGINCGSWELRS